MGKFALRTKNPRLFRAGSVKKESKVATPQNNSEVATLEGYKNGYPKVTAMSSEDTRALARELKTHAIILGGFIAIIWLLEIVNLLFLGGALNAYGIQPRNIVGLRGILFAPFLHLGFPHLIANTIPFLTLGWLIMLRETSDFFVVTAVTMLISGLGVWLFGAPNSIHVGASGVIFGYLGFLLLRGYFERSWIAILLSLIVGFFYGGIIWGVLPTQPGISWEGHLFGFVGDVIAARLLSRQKRTPEYSKSKL